MRSSNPGNSEIRQLARYQVRPEALEKCVAAADRIHSESREVKQFASILYPACLAPVEFVDYGHVVSNA